MKRRRSLWCGAPLQQAMQVSENVRLAQRALWMRCGIPAMCFSIQLALSLTSGFCDPPRSPWSPWARAHPAIPARTRPERRILFCSRGRSTCCGVLSTIKQREQGVLWPSFISQPFVPC